MNVRQLVEALDKYDDEMEICLVIGMAESESFHVERSEDGWIVLEGDTD